MITNYKLNVDTSEPQDGELMFQFETYLDFDEKAKCNKINRGKPPIRLLKSPTIMPGSLREGSFSKPEALIASAVSATKPKESKTRRLSSHSIELFDRLKLLIQEKEAGKNSYIVIGEILLFCLNFSNKKLYLQNNILL